MVRKLDGFVTDLLPVRLAMGELEATCLMELEGSSHLFLSPQHRLTIRAGVFSTLIDGKTKQYPGNPLTNLQSYLEAFKVASGLPPFSAGAVGYIGYDCVQYLEDIALPKSPATEDEACFYVFGESIFCDYRAKATYLSAEDEAALDRLEKAVRAKSPALPSVKGKGVEPRADQKEFFHGVRQVKEHILDGDIFQCVLSQRMEYESRENPLHIYARLRETSHSPYRYYFQSPTQAVVGASPEMLIRVTGGLVESCPIAGTRARGSTPEEDKRLERQLLRSPKERAEHVMLVDLSRNDLGRVCEPGTVRVKDFMKVTRFSHVMHLVSLVQGKLLKNKSPLSALFAAFPAGTLTGAPKIRAMKIISELESKRRGAYGGAVVMLDFAGNLDSCITIRTMIVTKDKVSVQAGAGIVADSTAKRELKEIEVKSLSSRLALSPAEAT